MDPASNGATVPFGTRGYSYTYTLEKFRYAAIQMEAV